MSFELGPALLFCPADRPERFAKAAERADAVILDLEDAVAHEAKAAARRALVDTPLEPARVIVRVNPAGSEAFALVIVEALAAGTPVAGYGPTLVEIRDRLGIDVGEPIFDPTPDNVAAAVEAVRSRRWDRERLRRAALGSFAPRVIARRSARLMREVV